MTDEQKALEYQGAFPILNADRIRGILTASRESREWFKCGCINPEEDSPTGWTGIFLYRVDELIRELGFEPDHWEIVISAAVTPEVAKLAANPGQPVAFGASGVVRDWLVRHIPTGATHMTNAADGRWCRCDTGSGSWEANITEQAAKYATPDAPNTGPEVNPDARWLDGPASSPD